MTVRMSAGKGTVEGFVADSTAGRLSFENMEIDQSCVRRWLEQFDEIVEAFPVRAACTSEPPPTRLTGGRGTARRLGAAAHGSGRVARGRSEVPMAAARLLVERIIERLTAVRSSAYSLAAETASGSGRERPDPECNSRRW